MILVASRDNESSKHIGIHTIHMRYIEKKN